MFVRWLWCRIAVAAATLASSTRELSLELELLEDVAEIRAPVSIQRSHDCAMSPASSSQAELWRRHTRPSRQSSPVARGASTWHHNKYSNDAADRSKMNLINGHMGDKL